MTDKQLVLPVEAVPNAFFVRGTSFIVTGPTNDLSIQVTFCEDVVRHGTMTVSAEESGGFRAEFDGVPRRLALGMVKLSLQNAKELSALLEEHILKTQEIIESLQEQEAQP